MAQEQQGQLQCSKCGQKFNSQNELQEHQKKHMSQQQQGGQRSGKEIA